MTTFGGGEVAVPDEPVTEWAAAGGDADRPWYTPGAYLVAPGVTRVPLPLPDDGLHSVNVYIVEEPDGVTLIDSGQATLTSRSALARTLGAIGHELRDIRRILVTHVHRDHYTLAVALRREFGVDVQLGRGEESSLRMVAEATRDVLQTQLTLLAECGAQSLAQQLGGLDDGVPPDLWEEPDEWLDSGPVPLASRVLDAIPTPGHTRGHVVFRDAEAGLLFAGDHVLPHITPSIGFEPAPPVLPLADYIRSLELVRSLPDTWLLPAHGPPTRSVHGRVDELLAHHAERLQLTLAPVLVADATALQVAERLVWTKRHRTLSQLTPFNRMLAVLETRAHLDLLVDRQRLTAYSDSGIRRYTTA